MESRLIFLLSAPRSGSSMLQRVIAEDSAVYSNVESFIMFHAFPPEVGSKLNQTIASATEHLSVHCANSPNLLDDARRSLTDKIYRSILTSQEKEYYLDKTPAYTRIASRIYALYPESRYIVLLRNPLSLLYSGLTTWLNGKYENLHWLHYDLVGALRDLNEFLNLAAAANNIHVVRYENFVANPAKEVVALNRFLGTRLDSGNVSYGVDPSQVNIERNSYFGDPKSVHLHTKPTAQYSENWVNLAHDPQTLLFGRAYLKLLGSDLLNALGYDYSSLDERLLQVAKSCGVDTAELRSKLDFESAIVAPDSRNAVQRMTMQATEFEARFGAVGRPLHEAYRLARNFLRG